jgi:hypothetical protein
MQNMLQLVSPVTIQIDGPNSALIQAVVVCAQLADRLCDRDVTKNSGGDAGTIERS